jgi:hypothetical protein
MQSSRDRIGEIDVHDVVEPVLLMIYRLIVSQKR